MRADFTPRVDLSAEPGTGSMRERRPACLSRLPPCDHAGPAGESIRSWLAQARAGRCREARLARVADNPLPPVHGRACYHPGDAGCNPRELDEPLSVHAVERFPGDLAVSDGWLLPESPSPSGRRVLVIGASRGAG